MNDLDWVALGIFVLSVVFNSGVSWATLRSIGRTVKDHENRIRLLEAAKTALAAVGLRGGV